MRSFPLRNDAVAEALPAFFQRCRPTGDPLNVKLCYTVINNHREVITMKALSIRPEYTFDIFMGEQTYEERTWQTDYRGDLLI